MSSDWDYINKHMGGHDEDGMPNFCKGIKLEDSTSTTKKTYYTKAGNKITNPKAYYSAVNRNKKK